MWEKGINSDDAWDVDEQMVVTGKEQLRLRRDGDALLMRDSITCLM